MARVDIHNLSEFNKKMRFLSALWALPFLLATAEAATETVTTQQATVSLISEREAVSPGEMMKLGIYFQIKPEWHIYWKNPGDSGLPPRVEMSSDPEGSEFSDLIFPRPERIPFKTQMNFGYEREALLFIDWKVPESATPGSSITVDAKLKWLICKEEC
ncbi:MAG: protein-disulfide reductase, partial [Proteobacteria bacterium]